MRWFDCTASRIMNGRIYTRKELIEMLHEDYPYVSPNSYTWAIAEMIKDGLLQKIGYNQYQTPSDKALKAYTPMYSEWAMTVSSVLETHLPNVRATVFESILLNEFLPEEKRISENIIFLEVEKEHALSVFRLLQQQKIPNLIYKPTQKDFCFYKIDDSVVITDLTSQAPVRQKKYYEIYLEKLLVDIFCDRLIKLTYSIDDFNGIVDYAQAMYLIDKTKLMRYAERRNKKGQMIEHCPQLAVDDTQAKQYAHYTKEGLLLAASIIVHDLSESQIEFFDYINHGNLTQGELAREIYHVSPQAITNRIKKLYRTIIRRMLAEHGFSEAEVKRKLGYKTETEFLKLI